MKARRGFTLVEIIVVVGIIAVLAGIIFAAFAPARERARETVCTSNLHQIWLAYSMYAADWDGMEPVKGVRAHYYELGLPSDEDDEFFFRAYVKNRDVLFCPSYRGPDFYPYRGTSYRGYSRDRDRWADLVAKRGPDLPFWRCDWHNPGQDPMLAIMTAPRWEVFRFNILRLGGRVQMVKVTRQDRDPWEW